MRIDFCVIARSRGAIIADRCRQSDKAFRRSCTIARSRAARERKGERTRPLSLSLSLSLSLVLFASRTAGRVPYSPPYTPRPQPHPPAPPAVCFLLLVARPREEGDGGGERGD
jgi:hypothetical protein